MADNISANFTEQNEIVSYYTYTRHSWDRCQSILRVPIEISTIPIYAGSYLQRLDVDA